MRILLAIFLSATLSPVTWGQSNLAPPPDKALSQYVIQQWQTQDGLPQNTVTSVAQTPDGYMWLGTKIGLVRFDGQHFSLFDKKSTPGITDNDVWALLATSDSTLWVATNSGGVVRVKNGTFTAFTMTEGLSNNSIWSLYQDREGTVWVGTAGGGVDAIGKDGSITIISKDLGGLSNDFVWSFIEDRDGAIWVSTDGGGLNRIKDRKVTPFPGIEEFANHCIMCSCADSSGALWFGDAGNGLIRLQDGKFSTFTKRDGLTNDIFWSLMADHENNLWVGTDGGALRFRNAVVSPATMSAGLSGSVVSSFTRDMEGNIWIGTRGDGLDRMLNGSATSFTRAQGLSIDLVYCVYGDSEGTMWLGTGNGGLNVIKDGKVTVYRSSQKTGLSADMVLCIAKDPDGSLWIGTDGGGINHLKNGKFTAYREGEGLANNTIWSLLVDSKGTLWAGTDGGGLEKFVNGKFVPLDTNTYFSGKFISAIFEDHRGGLWVGTRDAGLNWLHGDSTTPMFTSDGLPSNVVWSICEDAENNIWVGTSGGLARFEHGKFKAYTQKDGLLDDLVYAVIDDGLGNLWMSGNAGIWRIPKNQFDDLDHGRIARLNPMVFGCDDGMASAECSSGSPAAFRAVDGALWFPTIKGAVRIDPRSVAANPVVPPLVIEDITVNGSEYSGKTSFMVPPGEGQIEIHYAGLSYVAPEKVRFMYKLEGFDKKWVDAGTRRVAFYTNMPPGKYRFVVRACNDDGVWNEEGASFSFELKPHFYQTYWFYGVCALLVFGLGPLFAFLRMRLLARREKVLTLRVEERTNELKHEIAERKNAEEVLDEERSLLRTLIDSIPDEISLKDTEGKFLLANLAAQAALGGRELGDVVGKTDFAFMRPELAAGHREEEQRIIRTGTAILNVEHIRRNPQTQAIEKCSITNKLPIFGRQGDAVGILTVNRNLTERKKMEEQLVLAKHAAETANKAKSEFLANMSHEIRTPMNGILGMTELTLDTDLSDEQREYLGMVKTSAEALLDVINDILDFSKIESGRLDLDNTDMNLRDMLGDVMRVLAVRAHQKELELAYRVESDVPDDLIGDPGRLRQVITNLVGNAIKFTERGEVVVSVEMESVEEDQVMLHVAVSDTGIGIPPEKQKAVFEAFTQAEIGTTRKYGGTGLGLTISSRLVELMQGRIWLESVVGVGTTIHFTVCLGLQKEPSLRVPPAPPEQLHHMPVLIIDDNSTNRRILVELTMGWGMVPTAVDGGEPALDHLRRIVSAGEQIPLLLVDGAMPDMDGFEVVERLKRMPGLEAMTILMLTSATQHGDLERCRQLGIAAHIIKPVKPSELLDAILDAIGERQHAAAAQEPTPQRAVRRGSREGMILLVEDNHVNQRYAQRLLQGWGHTVTLAGTGQEALDCIQAGDFDVVLMDVQMPGMDGFEATGIIRINESQDPKKPHIPIIAMTAFAMKGDRERCLAAGMDAYVSKPVQADELFGALEHALNSHNGAVPAFREHGNGFSRETVLKRFDDDTSFVAELADIFINDYPSMLSHVQEAADRGDAEALTRAAHSLKGSLATFGATKAAEAALALEIMGRSGSVVPSGPGSAQEAMELLSASVLSVIPVLQSFIQSD